MENNSFLFLASGVVNDEGFWLIGVKSNDAKILDDKTLLECHRKELIGDESAKKILDANVTSEEIEAREKVTNHDLASFVDILQDKVNEDSEWIHYGLTSSDVVDTSNSLLILESLDFLIGKVDELISTLKNLAIKEKDTKIIGRTHGVFAEVTFLGNIISNWL